MLAKVEPACLVRLTQSVPSPNAVTYPNWFRFKNLLKQKRQSVLVQGGLALCTRSLGASSKLVVLNRLLEK
jgi:hypothetical protein